MAVQVKPAKSAGHHPAVGRVLKDATHGGPPNHPGPAGADGTTRFGYMFKDLAASWPAAHLPSTDPVSTVAALKALGAAMIESPPPTDLTQPDNSVIPPIYTYWGQFIDHDTTRNTDVATTTSDITATPFELRNPKDVPKTLRNTRHPALNLDSLYGDGPTFPGKPATEAADFYDGIKFKVGHIQLVPDPGKAIPGVPVVASGDVEHDVPRKNIPAAGATPAKVGVAQIADGRNDENLIIAQLHVAFLRFHNAVVDWIIAEEGAQPGKRRTFERARELVQHHYQWLVVNDFLATVTRTGTRDQVLFSDDHLFKTNGDDPVMPLEYSVAAFRFGHSMVRGFYDHNRNFGRPGTNFRPFATFNNMFQFTGKANPPFLGGTQTLPFNWVIEWDRFVDKGSSTPDHFARKIDTRLAPPLHTLLNEGNDEPGKPPIAPPIAQILKGLAIRNLLRGYQLGIPTGQKVAQKIGAAPLTPAELTQNNSQAINDALTQGGFLDNTPLWYYVLKEAEVRQNGNSLGEVGSRIVCETIIAQIRADEDSYLNASWTPIEGVKLANDVPIVSIGDLLKFAGVM